MLATHLTQELCSSFGVQEATAASPHFAYSRSRGSEEVRQGNDAVPSPAESPSLLCARSLPLQHRRPELRGAPRGVPAQEYVGAGAGPGSPEALLREAARRQQPAGESLL
ncbi:hypothetical protein AVEN_69778-1 [Araneus ventricosus]|uniref:Uncharacterized protein n=1 Tax=Araneus ventricosus TaxID=182803 RepID=A0A4Y2CVQ5_ARAVE|nr:hypothetical protein AVEN_69778-1 [Araneus ventricosus]